MQNAPTTLAEVSSALAKVPADFPAVFTTEAGDIGGGYHVTELKLADVQSIDCMARQSSWREAQVQILDGHGGTHMAAGQLHKIIAQSLKAVPDLADVPFSIEFSPENQGLSRYSLGAPFTANGKLSIPLESGKATCKPAADMAKGNTTNCC